MAGNSNSNNNDNEKKEISKERSRQEALVLQDFFIASQRKVEELRQTIGLRGAAGGGTDLDLSDNEKKLLNNIHSAGMVEGLMAGVASFVVLRRFPRYLARRAQKAAQQRGQQQQSSSSSSSSSSGYKLEQPPPPPPGSVNSPFRNSGSGQTTSSNPIANGGGAEQAYRYTNDGHRGGLLWRSFQFSLDATLSMLIAAYTSAYMADTETIKKSLTEIPLMEGRSALSDNFCPILLEEYQRQWKIDPNSSNNDEDDTNNPADKRKIKVLPFDRKDVLRHPNIGLLQAYIEFTQNCKRRQAVERRIRQERGMSANEPVAIPPPGVSPSDDEWNTDSGDYDGGGGGGGGGEGGSFNGNGDFFDGETQLNGDDDDWKKEDVSSFVEDQEDARKK